MPKVPKFTSGFALIDIEEGRAELATLVGAHFCIPFTLTGFLHGSASSVGRDDGTSREFAADVTHLALGTPRKSDTLGRPYALASEVKVGDRLICDGGFSCMKADAKKTVKRRAGRLKGVSKEYAKDPFARLYIDCKCGGHMLDGQLGEHGELIGLRKAD
jgi:hypothetical protein